MKKLQYLFILSLILQLAFAQETVDLLGFKSVNTDEGYVESLREIFRIELMQAGFDVKEIPDGEDCFGIDCAREIKSDSDYAFWGSITGLGEKYIIAIFYYDYKSGTVEHSDRLTSQTFEDVDRVAGRLVEGLVAGESASGVINKSNITQSESQLNLRRQNYYTVGFRIGYSMPFPDSYFDESMVTFQTIGLYEMEQFAVEGIFSYGANNGVFGDGESDVGADISMLYLFSKNDFAPYVSAGAGIHWLSTTVSRPESSYYNYEDDEEWYYYTEEYNLNTNGLALNLGGGMVAFQTYDFRLMLDVRYRMIFAGTARSDYWFGDNEPPVEDLGVQHSLGITFGITKQIGRRSPSCCFW
ncbi:MAG: hypothetical protein ACLFSQ_01210 [Candidatus Zixiibacteriota bacterium]